MIRPVVHLLLHFIVPGIVARFSFRDRWIRAWLIMALTIIVDLDHLLADPIYDPNRCSIGYHPLHTYPAILIYLVLTMIPKTRLVGLGLMIHMVLDGLDCIWMFAA
jgi:hypothetical protein